MFQAGVYSAIMHYLKAIEATGTDNAEIVIAKMKATPINDFFAKNGRIREDGRMVHDMYLMQGKVANRVEGAVGFLQITDDRCRATKRSGRWSKVAAPLSRNRGGCCGFGQGSSRCNERK